MAELNYRERQAGEVTIVDLQGDITIGDGAMRIDDTIKRMLGEGKKKILLNLGGVSYVDSCGLGNLVSGYNRVRGEGGQLRLLNPAKRVRDLMIITKLVTVFDSYDEEATALDSYN